MKKQLLTASVALGFALSASAPVLAQDSKVKVERPGYELKIKQDGDDYKIKETGRLPVEHEAIPEEHYITTHRQGQAVTVVKAGKAPESRATHTRAYAGAKKCTCPPKKSVARKTPAKNSVAYKAKPKNVAKAVTKQVIVRDTVFVTRVDTVYSRIDPAYFAGYRQNKPELIDNFKKLKIERENDGTIKLKKEYGNGREIKREFANEEDFNTYMEFKNF
jgi:hypothetical protein